MDKNRGYASRESQANHDTRGASASWEPSGVRAAGVRCLQARLDQARVFLNLF